MSRGNVLSYILAYVVFLSTVIAVGAQSMRHSLNPSLRSLTPIRMHQNQLIWNYYCLYIACPGCCKHLYVPRIALDSNTFELFPTWNFASTMSHEGQLQNTRPLNQYSVLDLLHENNSSILLKRMDYDKLLSIITSLQKSGPVDNVSQTKTILHSFKDLNSSVKNVNITTTNIKTSSTKVGFLYNNTFKSGRRTNEVSTAGTKSDIQPSVLLENIRDHIQKNWTGSTNDSLLGEATKKTMQNINNYEIIQLKNSTNDSLKSSGLTHESRQLNNQTKSGLTNETLKSNYQSKSGLKNEIQQSINQTKRHILFRKFRKQLDQVERKFLLSVFNKLTAISPEDRKENGISFLQSGFFLYQLLLSLSIALDRDVAQEIEDFLAISMPEADKVEILQRTAKWLPKSSNVLKFRWSSRLVLRRQSDDVGGIQRAADRAPLQLSWLHGNETAADLTELLNNMVLSDSGGGMHATFEDEEVSGGVCAAALGTACLRGAWRAAPTLLNDSLPFRDAVAAPNRTSRFFRLNDIMAYSHLHEWDAEAIEISYATPGLTLLILVPKEPSLRPLVERVASLGLDHAVGFMRPMRLAVTLPLYTLRMTLLLPNKLQDMGMPSLLTNGTNCQPVKLSHAVQRLMFWAEAGRNAFKDDGIEWDPRPELEIVVDRPYLFFVRWHNITIMNGVFAL